MPRAVELLQQGRDEELWQMCCGFIDLNIDEFMTIQRRLLQEQLELINNCALGTKIMRGARPRTLEEFRQQAPLTTYADYCPELSEKREDVLPVKPSTWVRTSGRSGEYLCRWVPITPVCSQEISIIMYGLGILSSCKERRDTSNLPQHPKMLYTIAPRPYMSGAMATML
ncbi:GH3 auxin-responsive promoter family protein, partial [Chloroflexota bacterium]